MMQKHSTWSAFNKLLKYVYCIEVNITFLKLIKSYKGAGEKLSKIQMKLLAAHLLMSKFSFSLVLPVLPTSQSLSKNIETAH